MAILDDIYKIAVTKTGRPDRVNETRQAVRDAVIEYHSLAFFGADIQEGELNVGARDNGRVNLGALIPNLRQVMAVYLPNGNALPKTQDGPGYQMFGKTLALTPSNISPRLTIQYATVPSPESSWIANQYPEAVATLAAAKVANICGNRPLASALFLEVGGIFPARSGFKQQIMMENDNYEPDL